MANIESDLKLATKERINRTLLRTSEMNYDEFDRLDFEEQQRIIREYHKKKDGCKGKNNTVMIGNGEHSIFIKANSKERVMIGSGEHSCFIEPGLTTRELEMKLEDKMDDVIYSKPIAIVKKIGRRIKR